MRNRPNDRNSYAGRGARAVALISSHPRESVSVFMGTAALGAIVINALFMQPGPHPAPIWSSKAPPPLEAPRSVALPQPRPVEAPVTAAPPLASTTARSRADIISDIQRELLQRGFYDGAVDGRWGGKTDAAAHEFVGVSGLKLPVEATEDLLRAIQRSNRKGTTGRAVTEAPAAPAHTDAIGELLVPKTQQAAASPKIAAIQRALSDFGYGQIKANGVLDADTQAAIERFERERKMPVSGQVSARLTRELATMTGRTLD